MVLIKLIWNTDGDFCPEVHALGIFQKEATWLFPSSADRAWMGVRVQEIVQKTLED